MPSLLTATLICHLENPNLVEVATSISSNIGAGKINWLAEGYACDISVTSAISQDQAAKIITQIIDGQPIDFAIQVEENRKKKVLIADMDSTMIDQECIDELAAEVGLKEKVSAITAKAMNGELEFDSALRERVALLKGLPCTISKQVIANRITLAKGGKTLLATMKAHGAWSALVSGGFTLFTHEIAGQLGFDENHANELVVADGVFTGKVKEPILGAEAKVSALNKIARDKSLSPSDFIAVGDGANDLPMLKLAGTGVALHAKPMVADQAKIRINHGDLTALLFLQGYHKNEFMHV